MTTDNTHRLGSSQMTKPARRLLGVLAGLAMVMMFSLLQGCLNLGFEKKASETTLNQEVAILVKQYRLCLQKYEDNPPKAKEHCSVYREAIKDLGPEAQRSVMAELLDRLEVKGKD